MKELIGTGVALVTPFQENSEKIDFQALERLLAHTSEGVDYWVVNGTTGEGATMTGKEKLSVLDFVKKNNPKKIPIVFGIGGYDTKAVLEAIEKMNFEGITAILSVSPYYNRPTQAGIIQHFEKIADKCPVPIILYNVPTRTGSNMKSSTTIVLSQHPNIVAIKEASSDLVQAMEIIQGASKDFLVLAGDDLMALPLIALGGKGVISVIANAFPVQYGKLVRAALAGDFAEARKYHYQLLDIDKMLFEECNPAGIKTALSLLGICADEVRLPLVEGTPQLKEKLQKAIQKVSTVA
ncbi:MAG: 4-hydroxy-tetrahydrodipicolinate synthase [Flammeovirgaceae bacterium]|nr:4-hydroxy-tetrahydrodipicolinate synthase [Flammeovirgaceae bacterium]